MIREDINQHYKPQIVEIKHIKDNSMQLFEMKSDITFHNLLMAHSKKDAIQVYIDYLNNYILYRPETLHSGLVSRKNLYQSLYQISFTKATKQWPFSLYLSGPRKQQIKYWLQNGSQNGCMLVVDPMLRPIKNIKKVLI